MPQDKPLPETPREMFAMARADLSGLLDRVLRGLVDSPRDARYAAALARSWDGTLAEHEAAASEGPLSRGAASVYARLARTIADPGMPSGALFDWLDAFPDAVVDLGG